MGASINHVERFWDFFSTPPSPFVDSFIKYIGLFRKVDIWPTPLPPALSTWFMEAPMYLYYVF